MDLQELTEIRRAMVKSALPDEGDISDAAVETWLDSNAEPLGHLSTAAKFALEQAQYCRPNEAWNQFRRDISVRWPKAGVLAGRVPALRAMTYDVMKTATTRERTRAALTKIMELTCVS